MPGKSTLLNALVGERMSIITHKPQTTRHRIIGILTGENFQIVFSDTPGYVRDPAYKMHKAMNRFVEGTLDDADLLLLVFDLTEELEDSNPVCWRCLPRRKRLCCWYSTKKIWSRNNGWRMC
jgi:GTP-binding protein Era